MCNDNINISEANIIIITDVYEVPISIGPLSLYNAIINLNLRDAFGWNADRPLFERLVSLYYILNSKTVIVNFFRDRL